MVDGALAELLGVHIRGLCDVDCAQLVGTDATDLAIDLADPTCPALPGELRRLGGTLARRRTRIVNRRHAGCAGSAVSGSEDGVDEGRGVGGCRVGWQAEVFGRPEFGVAFRWGGDGPVVVVDEVVAVGAEGGEVGYVCGAVV